MLAHENFVTQHVLYHMLYLRARSVNHVRRIVIWETFAEVTLCNYRTELFVSDAAGAEQENVNAQSFFENIAEEIAKLGFAISVRMCELARKLRDNLSVLRICAGFVGRDNLLD